MISQKCQDYLSYCLRVFFTLTWTNFKLRYYGSFLGYLWSLLRPLALFGVLYLVFTQIMKLEAPNYKAFLLLGIILWTFFSEATLSGMRSFIENYTIIRKINMPRILFVLAAVSASFIGLLFNLMAFFIIFLFDNPQWSFRMLWSLPMILALYFFAIGISLFLSIIVVKLRDVNTIWEVAIQLGFWFTPVMYPMTKVSPEYRFWMFINPLSGILEYTRHFLVNTGAVTKIGYLYVLIASFTIFILGCLFFLWKEAEMVEEL